MYHIIVTPCIYLFGVLLILYVKRFENFVYYALNKCYLLLLFIINFLSF